MKSLESRVVSWLKAKLKESGMKGLLCWLSGGVDSAVVAGLIKKSAGKNHLCLFMPCHSAGNDKNDVLSMAKKFGLKTRVIDISRIFDSLLKILPKAGGLAAANLKARLRMLTLYYFANKLNYLVVGTGNKSELSMGYFTKYGDG